MNQFEVLADRFGMIPCRSIESFAFVKNRISLIPYLFAKQKNVLPIEETEKEYLVAIQNPLDLSTIEELRFLLKKEITPLYFPKSVIESAIEKCYSQKEGEAGRFFSDLKKEGKIEDLADSSEGYDLLEQAAKSPVIRIVDTLLLEAIQQGASDIHFEPRASELAIRYRIDGVLQPREAPPKEYQVQVLTRIKVMAKLDIAENRLPQDGRIKLRHGGRDIDFRVSTLPTVYGERIVLRILDRGNITLGLDRLGMDPKLLKMFRKEIHSPEGIILVTGPTGSGKTTTLYSALSEIDSKEVNIMTIEDPVEYKLPGISQIHVNRKISLDFAKGLRHILRQDPDVIMIGEIRDKETAEIAIQASLTGHLVLTTLHTNDAPSALTRLADMGIESYLLASSVLAVLAQRLVRLICPNCKKEYSPTEEELMELGVRSLPKKKLYKGSGCNECLGTGYKGRMGIYEFMPIDEKIKEQVLKSQDAEQLKQCAISLGMHTLYDQGIELVFKGLTTSREILRVTRSLKKGDL